MVVAFDIVKAGHRPLRLGPFTSRHNFLWRRWLGDGKRIRPVVKVSTTTVLKVYLWEPAGLTWSGSGKIGLDLDLDSTRIQVDANPHSSGCIGPHSDAIVICLELPPLLPPRWFPSLTSHCWHVLLQLAVATPGILKWVGSAKGVGV